MDGKKIFLIIINLFIFSSVLSAQNTSKIKIAAGEEYRAGTLHKIFFGELWRETWITPVEVDILNLKTFAGGLTPLKKGGGFQTKSLRLMGKDGKEYKFRSINKDPVQVLPIELRTTFVADILKDQISTSNPYAALVTAPILQAMEILQAEPKLVYMPDTELLGEFRNEFANILGTIEEHPEEGFANSLEVKSTFNLFKEMEEDHDNIVNAAEYLKVRLIDMFIGDWDRHTDQWRWARYDENHKKIWKPIPRDRDQAFARFDGIFPWMTALSVAQLEGFSGTYPEIEDLTWSGRFLDRRLLTSLTRVEWDSITAFVLTRLTDQVIVNAVNKLPGQVFAIEGDKLTFTLIRRRNRLNEISEVFYRQIFKYVEIRGSDKREYAEINRADDKTVSVKLYKRDKDNGNQKGQPFYSRSFNCEETKELRIFLLGGDDYVIIRGKVNSSIDVIINGGKGDNDIIDSSVVNGYLLGFIPFVSDPETKSYIYTVNKKTNIAAGPSTCIDIAKEREPADEFERFEPSVRDYGHDWRFSPWFEANTDVGLFIGGGPILYKFGYLAHPYVYKMELKAGYANKGNRYKLSYSGEFYSLFKDVKLQINALASGLEVLNFFGIGNDTRQTDKLREQDFYRVEQQQYIFNPSVEFSLSKNLILNTGAELIFTDTDTKQNSFLQYYQPYGINNISLLGFTTGLTMAKSDHPVVPESGYYANLSGAFFPELLDSQAPFGKINLDLRYYTPVNIINSVLALKGSGENIWGNYPFFKAAFLGGAENLKGFEIDRFSGDASAAFNSELRTFLTDLYIIFPGKLGTILSAETGRVFVQGQVSRLWHSSYGGGIWLSVINEDLTFSLTAAKSIEEIMIYLKFGFAY